MLLMHSYNQVIHPRGTLLKERLNYFDLEKAFFTTDEQFCKHFGIEKEELKKAQLARKRYNHEEKDYLWAYVDAI